MFRNTSGTHFSGANNGEDTSFTTHFHPEEGGGTASETLVSKHHTTLHNNSEKHEFYLHRREILKLQIIVYICVFRHFTEHH
jgi:hypothetical protein